MGRRLAVLRSKLADQRRTAGPEVEGWERVLRMQGRSDASTGGGWAPGQRHQRPWTWKT